MRCEYCEILNDKDKKNIVYEDDDIAIIVKDMILTPGQVTVIPKNHYTILEMVPDNILSKCSIMANKVGRAIFEGLGCEGTNIIIQNGLSGGQKSPHFGIEVIPRREQDGLNLEWKPKHLMEDEMESIFHMLQKEVKNLVQVKEKGEVTKKEPSEALKENKKEPTENNSQNKKKENYLLKSLRKIP